jgi:putative flippase GtrA
MKHSIVAEVLPRGTLQRFGIAGGFNTFLFWIIWELLRSTILLDLLNETAIWSISWAMSSLSAHYVHRFFTFDGRKNVKNTIMGALSVYAFGMAGSTLSYDALLSMTSAPIRLIFLVNMLCWGLFTWATMRWFVFGYASEEE